jgi:hypothetical protein
VIWFFEVFLAIGTGGSSGKETRIPCNLPKRRLPRSRRALALDLGQRHPALGDEVC